jgi:hypothetical protein
MDVVPHVPRHQTNYICIEVATWLGLLEDIDAVLLRSFEVRSRRREYNRVTILGRKGGLSVGARLIVTEGGRNSVDLEA